MFKDFLSLWNQKFKESNFPDFFSNVVKIEKKKRKLDRRKINFSSVLRCQNFFEGKMQLYFCTNECNWMEGRERSASW